MLSKQISVREHRGILDIILAAIICAVINCFLYFVAVSNSTPYGDS